MLDFYIVQDEQPQPDYPEQAGLEFVGALDNRTFANLQRKEVIGMQFNFYSDFRLDTELINQIRQHIFKTDLQTDDDVKKLLILLDTAERNRSGLIAYGD
ncbi:hypothetical protein [Niabella beijingensis]|uniref:hypothetical protein n=1 Tax=Niabella beijingensis TaxID=2872700 RepID=UPI001CC01A3D|nr:hypothetical protein [Niabella beijingensis]MBZ4187511.1 hypothetical protein [Niabella beijingensis]